MRRSGHRLLAAFLLATPLLTAGCFGEKVASFCFVSDPHGYAIPMCDVHVTATVEEGGLQCRLMHFNAAGCPIPWSFFDPLRCPGSGQSYDGSSIPCGGLYPGDTATVCIKCEDPLIVELPIDWFVVLASWRNPATGDTGLVLVTPAAEFPVNGSPLQVTTDPGAIAYVLRLDRSPAVPTTLDFHFVFEPRNTPGWCVKGISTVQTFIDGFLVALSPPVGASLDFTKLPGHGPTTVCLGPDTTTPVRKPTWGALKAHYR